MKQRKICLLFLVTCMILATIAMLVACGSENTTFGASSDLELTMYINKQKENDDKRVCEIDKNLEIVESQIGEIKQTVIKNIQNFKNKLQHDFLGISDYDLALKLLHAVGYTDAEIENMNDQTKLSILDAKDITMQKSAALDSQGLNFNVTYTSVTLHPVIYKKYPVDFYLVRATWSWANPTLIGAPDYIGIKLEDGKDYYSLLSLKAGDELAEYEYCNLSYNKKVYNGTEINTTYNLKSKIGQAVNENVNLKSRTFVMDMPKNEIQYEQPDDPLIYKTVYTDFVGEAQFILGIKYSPDDFLSQYIGLTYGHSEKECSVTYSESLSTSLGFSAGVEGPSGELGLGISSNWEYSETTIINSKYALLRLNYDKITIEDGKVYNIVNQNFGKPLECPAGVTQEGTPLRLGDSLYTDTENALKNANWQWRVEFNKRNNNIILHPVLDNSKRLAFQFNRVVLENNPGLTGFSSGITSPIRIQSSDDLVPQHDIIIKCFKLQGGANYSYVMDCANDFYSSIAYSKTEEASIWQSNWEFVEVPEEDIAEEEPMGFKLPNLVTYIQNVATQKTMDICNGSIDNGATVLVYDKKSSSVYDDPTLYNQSFKLTKTDGNAYFISPFHVLGFNLDIKDASSVDGARIQMFAANGSAAQKFKFYPVSRTGDSKVQFYIATAASGYTKVLKANDDTTISQSIPKNQENQFWTMSSNPRNYLDFNANDSYCIRNIASRYYFDVSGNKTANNTPVLQYYFSGDNNQRMKFVSNGDGSFYIVPQNATNRVLELSNNSNNGNKLKIYSKRNDKAYQRFKIVRAKNNRFFILTGASGYNKALAVDNTNVGCQIVQKDKQENTLSYWAIDKYDDTSLNSIIKLDTVKRISINGTTEQNLYFSVPYLNNYSLETVGNCNMTMPIYWDTDGDGVYELLEETTTGGRDNNAAKSFWAAGSYRIKITVHGAVGNSGYAGVILYKII